MGEPSSLSPRSENTQSSSRSLKKVKLHNGSSEGVPIGVKAGLQDGFADKEFKRKSSFRDALSGTIPSDFEMGFEANGVEDLSEDESHGDCYGHRVDECKLTKEDNCHIDENVAIDPKMVQNGLGDENPITVRNNSSSAVSVESIVDPPVVVLAEVVDKYGPQMIVKKPGNKESGLLGVPLPDIGLGSNLIFKAQDNSVKSSPQSSSARSLGSSKRTISQRSLRSLKNLYSWCNTTILVLVKTKLSGSRADSTSASLGFDHWIQVEDDGMSEDQLELNALAFSFYKDLYSDDNVSHSVALPGSSYPCLSNEVLSSFHRPFIEEEVY
ncbi:hypothetical protein GH714_041840 [Hevea brasiliensis]|uniref:Uncharacterized protein n=1 Tax=Hevea brasiliensis TaxID=3981 RepID=A0A6A6MX75_HEVBR|nr:hypothetical protein GH714_041840 [Hevea brasiliensis]